MAISLYCTAIAQPWLKATRLSGQDHHNQQINNASALLFDVTKTAVIIIQATLIFRQVSSSSAALQFYLLLSVHRPKFHIPESLTPIPHLPRHQDFRLFTIPENGQHNRMERSLSRPRRQSRSPPLSHPQRHQLCLPPRG